MKEEAKALLSKNQNELSAARTLEVFLDRADNVIEGGLSLALFKDGVLGLILYTQRNRQTAARVQKPRQAKTGLPSEGLPLE